MNVIKTGSVGFTQIFTSENLPASFNEPNKKPYIVFTLPADKENLQYIRKINRLAKLGILDIDVNARQFIVTITSDRKVVRAIDIFLEESDLYPSDQNDELRNNLIRYKDACIARLRRKPQKTAPPKSKSLSGFEERRKGEQPETANVTHRVVKKKNPQKKYIHKENLSGRSISELETFNGFCYRLLLGDRHPKVSLVHGKNGERAGLVSKKFTSFTSLRDIRDLKGNLTGQELVDAEVVKVWVASYVEEENDLHSGNYGLGPDGFYVKIDDDQATWPLTSKYSEVDPEKGRPDFAYPVSPVDAFPVTKRDILNFPKLEDAQPNNWPGKNSKTDTDSFVKNKKFINDKWYMFLKRILVPREVYEAIGLATISSDKTRERFVDHKCNKTEELKRVLLNTPEFLDYLISNPKVIEQIKDEFAEYNKDYKKEADGYLLVDLDKIEKNFNSIRLEIVANRQPPSPPKFKKNKQKQPAQKNDSQNQIIPLNEVAKPSIFERLKTRAKKRPILTGVLVGLGVAVIAAAIVTAIVFTGGIAAAPMAAAAATVGTFITAGAATGTVASIAGVAVIGTGLVVSGAAVGVVSGVIYEKTASAPLDIIRINEGNNNNEKQILTQKEILEQRAKSLNKAIVPIINDHFKKTGSFFEFPKTEIGISSSTETFFNKNGRMRKQQDVIDTEIDIENIIIFMQKNIDFFAAPFKNQQEFAIWASENEYAKELSLDLMDALEPNQEDNPPILQFQEAILGGAKSVVEKGKILEIKYNGLLDGDDNLLKELLINNIKLSSVLIKHMRNPAIDDCIDDWKRRFKYEVQHMVK